MNPKQLICRLVLAIALSAIMAGTALASTIIVDKYGSGAYTTIQAGINAAANGDTVLVLPGTYPEAIVIGKNITLLGRNVEPPFISSPVSSSSSAVALVAGASFAQIVGFRISSPNGAGISCVAAGSFFIDNCIIKTCAGDGIYVNNSNALVYASNNVICANSLSGISVPYGSYWLYSNIVAWNSKWGLYDQYSSGLGTNEYNCFFGNSPNFGNYAAKGPGDIEQDPQFVDPMTDYHLKPGSPCIDKGRPGESYYDCDGTRNDMGIYGGPNAYCGPGPVVTDLQIVPPTVVKGETFKIQATGATR